MEKVSFEEKKRGYGRIVVADLSWLIHRGFHAMRNLSGEVDGVVVPTGHYFSLGRFVQQIKNNFPSTLLVLCADSYPEGKQAVLNEYKKDRPRYFELKEVSKSVLRMLTSINGVVGAVGKGIEADEIMYTISKESEVPCVVYSGDNDLLQAISDNTILSRKIEKGVFIPIEQGYVDDKYGVPLEKILFYRILVGDPSDNIPGVYTGREAKKIIKKYDTLQDFLMGELGGKEVEIERNRELMELKVVPVQYWKSSRAEALKEAERLGQRAILKMIWKG